MHEKALLAPGLHDFSEAEIANHFLASFPNSTTRAQLISGLRLYCEGLKAVGIPFEVWIDGSFATDKQDPNDIDLVAFASAAHVNALKPEVQVKLSSLFDRMSAKTTFGCDAYFAITDNVNLRSYWRGWFGFDRDEQPKGIARIMIEP